MRIVVKTKLVFVHTLARCFCLFLAFYAGLFVCFAFTKIADAERNRLEFAFGRNNSLKEFAQSGKRVGAGARKSGIGHGRILCKRSGLSEKRRGHIQKIIRWLLP